MSPGWVPSGLNVSGGYFSSPAPRARGIIPRPLRGLGIFFLARFAGSEHFPSPAPRARKHPHPSRTPSLPPLGPPLTRTHAPRPQFPSFQRRDLSPTPASKKKGKETQQRASRERDWLLGFPRRFSSSTQNLPVSLSMKFQASRFSASGRKVPLEPRRSEACRSCQPMHVLSFGEGRMLKKFVSITEFCIQAFGIPTHLCFHRAF